MKTLTVILFLTLSALAHAECYTADKGVAWFDLLRAEYLLKAAIFDISQPQAPNLNSQKGVYTEDSKSVRFAEFMGKAAEGDIQRGLAFTVPAGTLVEVIGKLGQDPISQLRLRGQDVFMIAATIECK
jgi:hypothetical protein